MSFVDTKEGRQYEQVSRMLYDLMFNLQPSKQYEGLNAEEFLWYSFGELFYTCAKACHEENIPMDHGNDICGWTMHCLVGSNHNCNELISEIQNNGDWYRNYRESACLGLQANKFGIFWKELIKTIPEEHMLFWFESYRILFDMVVKIITDTLIRWNKKVPDGFKSYLRTRHKEINEAIKITETIAAFK